MHTVILGSHIQAIYEAFALCKSKGGDLDILREALVGGSANSWTLENLANAVIDKNEKACFRINLQFKDLKLASEISDQNESVNIYFYFLDICTL